MPALSSSSKTDTLRLLGPRVHTTCMPVAHISQQPGSACWRNITAANSNYVQSWQQVMQMHLCFASVGGALAGQDCIQTQLHHVNVADFCLLSKPVSASLLNQQLDVSASVGPDCTFGNCPVANVHSHARYVPACPTEQRVGNGPDGQHSQSGIYQQQHWQCSCQVGSWPRSASTNAARPFLSSCYFVYISWGPCVGLYLTHSFFSKWLSTQQSHKSMRCLQIFTPDLDRKQHQCLFSRRSKQVWQP